MPAEPHERPLTLDDALVLELEHGRKRQARRVIPLPGRSEDWSLRSIDTRGRAVFESRRTGARRVCTCADGAVGDRLYIRQNWRTDPAYDRLSPGELVAKVTRVPVEYRACGSRVHWYEGSARAGRHRAAMHMPRAIAKTRVAIEGLTVQRLQSIREEDVILEGFDHHHDTELPRRAAFAQAWSRIHGPQGRGWGSDPWVWVIGLEVLR